jgi:uncharacterized protein
MSNSARMQAVKFIRSHVGCEKKISLEFGYGETFLHFDEFLSLADCLRSGLKDTGKEISINCATNGTTLDEDRMEKLAERRISLCFSIDGPQEIHDACRRDKKQMGTYHVALAAWQFYRHLSLHGPHRPSCSTLSVLSKHSRLLDLIEFWSALGQKTFRAVIELPSRFTKKESETTEWISRQEAYLSDLEIWAMAQARHLDPQKIFLQYCGPNDLFALWERIFWKRQGQPCGAGENTIAIDSGGDLYPCEAFIGSLKWQIGNIFEGIFEEKLVAFRKAKREAVKYCKGCPANLYCERCCFGRIPDQDIANNFLEGCWFAKRLVDIAIRSYRILMGHSK